MKHLRQYIRQLLVEKARSFTFQGSPNRFRVEMPGVGYAQGGQNVRFRECQDDVDAIMQMPEFIEAKEKWQSEQPPGFDIKRNPETGKYERVPENGPPRFIPRYFSVDNAWINNPEKRGKGFGRQIYEEFIRKAVEFSSGDIYGGVFITGAHCVQTPNATSSDAKRVWEALVRDYPTSSGWVIFIRTNK
jgi:hypothetical protein